MCSLARFEWKGILNEVVPNAGLYIFTVNIKHEMGDPVMINNSVNGVWSRRKSFVIDKLGKLMRFVRVVLGFSKKIVYFCIYQTHFV